MAKVVILGSAGAVPDLHHENTHLAIASQDGIVLVDAGSNLVVRLPQAGLDLQQVTDLVLTHFHPDHVSGVAPFIMNSWLLGRKAPLTVHGLAYTLDRVEQLMDFYEWRAWPRMYPVTFHRVEEGENCPVLENPSLRISASMVKHMIPNFGLRMEFLNSPAVLAYSCDTEPSQQVINLAKNADVLLHEASGATLGHSSAAQAGAIAQEAGAGKLVIIHYPVGDFDAKSLVKEAQETFSGTVVLAEDFMELEF